MRALRLLEFGVGRPSGSERDDDFALRKGLLTNYRPSLSFLTRSYPFLIAPLRICNMYS
jgi:hypothetical protein